LQALQGYLRALEFDRMRRSDYQAKMNLSAVKNPLRAAKWSIQPADDSPEAEADAKFIEHILFKDLGRPWSKFLAEALTVCEFGFAPFEMTHVVRNNVEFGQYVSVRLGYRSPKTIHRFNVDPTGKLVSISQYANGDLSRTVDIPAEWLLLFNLDQEGSNYEGISLLRPSYGCWKRKDVYLKINAIGIERFAIPTPLVELPEGDAYKEQYDRMVSALEAYSTHQANFLTYPKGWTVNLHTNTYDPEKVEVSIDSEDKRATKAFLANFLELGMGTSGSYALSNDLSDFFLGGIEYLADEIKEPINSKLIPHLIKINRGERAAYPTLISTGISDKIGKEFAEMLGIFIDKKVVRPDDQLEDFVREQAKLPKRSDQGVREVQAPSNPFSLSEKVRNALKVKP
jgi:hypothetical protein